MSAADSLNYLQVQENPDIVKSRVWHHAGYSPKAYMKAPILHVGTEQASADLKRGTTKDIHKMRIHPDAQIHNEVFHDASANAIHFTHLLMNKQLASPSVSGSMPRMLQKVENVNRREGFKTFMEMAEEYGVHRGLEALNQGKVIPYENLIEDPGAVSLMVPNPRRNIRHLVGRPADPNKVLPMSSDTLHQRDLYRTMSSSRFKNYSIQDFYNSISTHSNKGY